jgi:hypothetical protein
MRIYGCAGMSDSRIKFEWLILYSLNHSVLSDFGCDSLIFRGIAEGVEPVALWRCGARPLDSLVSLARTIQQYT